MRNLILDENIVWDSGKRDVCWEDQDYPFFVIDNGYWFIQKGAMWDGATIVPDGPDDPNKPNYPITWLATLIHDLGYTFMDFEGFPYSKKELDGFFYLELKRAKFKLAWLYYIGVRVFGGIAHLFGTIREKIIGKSRAERAFKT